MHDRPYGATRLQAGRSRVDALSILVGISIDYTLHLAPAYMETPDDMTSDEKMRDACKHAGISVFSGALTISLSGFVLLFSTITFFSTFGLFILATALLSIVSRLLSSRRFPFSS